MPILALSPVDIRTIAATIGATVAAPYQEIASRNIESIAAYLPINHVLSYVQCFDLSIDVESMGLMHTSVTTIGLFDRVCLVLPTHHEQAQALLQNKIDQHMTSVTA